jgi:hypothetical protein
VVADGTEADPGRIGDIPGRGACVADLLNALASSLYERSPVVDRHDMSL